MAEFQSKFSGLGFYVDGSLRVFRGGRYVTDDKAEIDVLTGLSDVTRIDMVDKKPEKQAERKTEHKAEPKESNDSPEVADKPEKPAAAKKKGGKSGKSSGK